MSLNLLVCKIWGIININMIVNKNINMNKKKIEKEIYKEKEKRKIFFFRGYNIYNYSLITEEGEK